MKILFVSVNKCIIYFINKKPMEIHCEQGEALQKAQMVLTHYDTYAKLNIYHDVYKQNKAV